MSIRDVVIISSIDWSRNWQIHQHLATSLVEAGHRVLFIENTGVRAPRPGDFGRIRNRIRNWLKSTRGFLDVRDNLTIFSPLIAPFPYSPFALLLNRFLMSSAIGKWMRVNRFNDPLVISFLPTPLAQQIIDDMYPLAVIYYCADNMAAGSKGASRLHSHENRFFTYADAVFCTSNTLMERAAKFNSRVLLAPAGVDFEKFIVASKSEQIPAALSALPRPRIGYIGTIGAVFNQSMLLAAARALPDASFLLIGPESVDISMLRTEPNIHILGARPHAEIPYYLNACDITVIPYIRNAFADSVYPCKLNEYLAVGKPVVTTNLREMQLYAEHHPGVIEVVSDTSGFIAAIQAALKKGQDPDAFERRVAAARQNSWEKRFQNIMSVINELIQAKYAIQPHWKTKFLQVMRRGQMKMLKVIVAFTTVYALLFYTPFMGWAGRQLVVQQGPSQVADAIVVFSGDGESGYINAGYQKRALDAIKLYQEGFGRTIVLSSGKRFTLSETEVIRALLVKKGVPESDILIAMGEPTSTFENVTLTAETLRRMKFKRVLFVTAPYHSRRASMVWAKQAPDIDVAVVRAADEMSSNSKLPLPIKTVRVILFEYAAIFYYWLKGWL